MSKFSVYTTKNTQELVLEFKTDLKNGLSLKDRELRLVKYGYNELKSQTIKWYQILLRQFKSSFVYLLLIAAFVAILLGEYIDGMMILFFVAINAFLGFYQEYHSEKTLTLLKKYTQPTAKILSDGKEIIVPTKFIVPGDIVILNAGDVVPCDFRIISDNDLAVDESILTGESSPVIKKSTPSTRKLTEIYQASNICFSDTTVTSGRGVGIVFATGKDTTIGDVATLTGTTVRESSFEKNLRGFSSFILRLVLITLIFVFLANILIKGNSVSFVELIIFSIALAVSVIPEALPVVMTFSLSRGALLLAKSHVVVKRLSAIEDLGSIEVLCTDKTGTLTENKLEIHEILASDKQNTLICAALATSFFSSSQKQSKDAFDKAIINRLTPQEHTMLNEFKLIDEIPFDPIRKRNSVLVQKKSKNELIIRGAAEIIIKHCRDINVSDHEKLSNWISQQGISGRRVIAVATKNLTGETYEVKEEEKNLHFVGLLSFTDPIKHTCKPAIQKAEKLGVKIKILTGDSREVAFAVAKEIGLINSPLQVITGEQLDSLSIEKQHEMVEEIPVFARVSPNQKFKIIQLLKEKYEIGFLGEGINDAPALKVANVGLVVSEAADIAREAADIILLRKGLEVIVDGIHQGRSVFANTIKYIKSTLTSNFGNFYAVAISSLFINFLPMLPLQILLVNLLSDFPMISVATDTVDLDEVKKPKSYQVREIALFATMLGFVSTFFDFIFFALYYKISPATLQTNWFIGSILTELVFIYSVRTRFFFLKTTKPSTIILVLTIFAAITTIIIPFTAIGHAIFHFSSPTLSYLLFDFGLVITYFITSEGVKLFYYRFVSSKT